MVGFAVAIILGGTALLRLPVLLDTGLLSTLVPVALFGASLRGSRYLSGFVIGLWLSSATVATEQALRITTRFDTAITGVVTGLPGSTGQAERFYFRVTSGELGGRQLRLSWREPPTELVPGQVWHIPVRLRAPTGSVNFGIFDYERWLFLKRIHGTGYVPSSMEPVFLGNSSLPVDQARYGFRHKLLSVVPPDSISTFLALTVGDTSLLDQSDWEILNRTGTTHLLIVSGLHIGLVASLFFLALRVLGLGLPVRILLTIIACGAYALLSGWGLPIQRAFIMTLVFLVSLYFSRFMLLPFQLGLACVLVLAVDPLATLGAGFWLSFGAVAALLLALSGQVDNRVGVNKWIWSSLKAQWVVYLALLPLLGFTSSQLPIGSILVNVVAIPWVGMLLVPLLLVSSILLLILPPVGEGLLGLCHFLVTLLWKFLETAAGLNIAIGVPALNLVTCIAALAGVAVLLAPAGLVPRWPGLLFMLVMLAGPRPLREGDMRLTFLDVGQGLSVLIETANHFQLYDTGPTFGTSFSAANQFVIPTLRQAGAKRLEHLIISHADNDHAGGLFHIVSQVPVHQTIRYGNCDEQWKSDGVVFTTFSAREIEGTGVGTSENNRSCLMMIEVHDARILLTGDIEAGAEYELLRSWLSETVDRYSVDVMSVPHHGSDSSSTPAFLNLLDPDLAIISSGYQNRFNHPDPVVMERYNSRSVSVLNTASSGAIEILFLKESVQLKEARRVRQRIWRRSGSTHGFNSVISLP